MAQGRNQTHATKKHLLLQKCIPGVVKSKISNFKRISICIFMMFQKTIVWTKYLRQTCDEGRMITLPNFCRLRDRAKKNTETAINHARQIWFQNGNNINTHTKQRRCELRFSNRSEPWSGEIFTIRLCLLGKKFKPVCVQRIGTCRL